MDGPDGPRTREISPALNAGRIHTALLMNEAGTEFLASMQLYSALRQHHQPVEVWIYPNELHQKWQPQHRRRIYERNLDWLSFWLRDLEDPGPLKRDQYVRWRQLRDEWTASTDQ